jgi:hypothetical protein
MLSRCIGNQARSFIAGLHLQDSINAQRHERIIDARYDTLVVSLQHQDGTAAHPLLPSTAHDSNLLTKA